MKGTHISKNGILIPTDQALLPIDHIEFAYGFGVYENIRLRKGALFFAETHVDRLFVSAESIGLTHSFEKQNILKWINELIHKNNIDSCNIKIMLIGGNKPLLYIFELAPKFVDKKLYKTGVHIIISEYERFLPKAKTLNMLPSYILYKNAMKQNAYDALLHDSKNIIHEGTRSNVFFVKDNTLYTPPKELILEGVTRSTVIACAKEHGLNVEEQNITLDELPEFDGTFMTNTSGKIVPVRSIGETISYETIHPTITQLISDYATYIIDRKQQIL